jgi:hypothetical protein
MGYLSKASDPTASNKYILLILSVLLALCTGALSWYARSQDEPPAVPRHEERLIRLFGGVGVFTVDCHCPRYLVAQTPRKITVNFTVNFKYPLAAGTNRPLKNNEGVEVLAEVTPADAGHFLNHHKDDIDHKDTYSYTRMDDGDLASKLAPQEEFTLARSSDVEVTVDGAGFSGIVFTLSDYLEGEGPAQKAEQIQLSMTSQPSLLRRLRPVLYACAALALGLAFLYWRIAKFRVRKEREEQILSPAKTNADRDVFISYKMEDVHAAERVCAALEGQRISCWIAPRDIPPGQVWAAAIVEGLQRSKNFVLLLSSHSCEAKQISREAELADRQNIPIIILRLEDVQPSKELLYFLGNLQWLDAFGGRLDWAVDRLAGTLRSSASRAASGK